MAISLLLGSRFLRPLSPRVASSAEQRSSRRTAVRREVSEARRGGLIAVAGDSRVPENL
jgi:hypothetical protein